ncbi:MAG: RcnB family protein [Alphaproteobacteria bacterium]|nr:RcnB family protein [Alphaproteobacteria bacterium]
MARSGRQARYYDGRRWNDYQRWDRQDWRRNQRYNWQGWRASNRSLYRPGRYYSPYRNHSYSRLIIGINLGSVFFGSRYQIQDPWRYRLPEVYGPYRWVRYYDDVLLVDIYSGEVVDVIYDFFW